MALWLAAALAACSPPQAPSIALGERAPEFSRRDLDGSEIALSSFAGQPVVLNFWATWCQPCRREFPGLRELEAAGAARVVGVALDEEGAERVRPFVDRERLDYTILIGDRSLFALYDGLVIPYTLLLDGELRIANIYRGPVDKSRLEEDLARLARGA